jgi:hypothetical protein
MEKKKKINNCFSKWLLFAAETKNVSRKKRVILTAPTVHTVYSIQRILILLNYYFLFIERMYNMPGADLLVINVGLILCPTEECGPSRLFQLARVKYKDAVDVYVSLSIV